MKELIKSKLSLLAVGVCMLPAIASSAVTITFREDGANVTATITGSLKVPKFDPGNGVFKVDIDGVLSDTHVGGSSSLYTWTAGNSDGWIGGTSGTSSGLNQDPDSFTGGPTFGYTGTQVYVPDDTIAESVITPTGTWTWIGETLESIGVAGLLFNPTLVLTTGGVGGGDTITVVAVPEPSSALTLCLSSGLLLLRRKRS